MSTAAASTPAGRLDTDWAVTATSGRARRTLRTWKADPTVGAVFADFDCLDEVITRLHDRTAGGIDELLGALIGFAQHGDEIAGRLVVQAFVPLAVSLANRGRRGDLEYQADTLAMVAEMVATFPLERRRDHIAGHLAFMVRRGLYRRHRRCRWSTVSIDDDTVAAALGPRLHVEDHDGRIAADRVADIVCRGRSAGRLDDDQARLLLLVAAGHNVASLARDAGCHRSTMGDRVSRAVQLVAA